MNGGRIAVFALVVGLVSGYQIGRAEPEQPDPSPPTTGVPSATTSPPTSTTTAAPPTPSTVPASAGPRDVLLVGDSILRQAGTALTGRLAGGHRVHNAGVNGS